MVPVIAIDGLAASGKGTVAKRVAAALGFHYLNSGALYRLVALSARKAGIRQDDGEALATVANSMNVQFLGDAICLDGLDVRDTLSLEATSQAASIIAAIPKVRAALVARQRSFRQAPGLVADGRDMGTVIFPDAKLKIFLTADVSIRAQRRTKQLMEKGILANIATLLPELQERDARDISRTLAPSVPAEDAVVIDSSRLGIDEVASQIIAHARRCGVAEGP